ncbi:PGF-pre-PGF domain-containing protein [Halobellus rufus]|uniref:PGF-pre-PGF domain-containing protein n=1 Tax=Halobellus rufus TaxID=1448860 RepID=UPI00067904FE|nr:PGF-pre-PGF domain-containing protein [Halobellus rufus]
MTRSLRLPIDRSQALAAVLALALVASASGAATTALLSDREDVSVEVSVEQSPVSAFHVEPIDTCEPAMLNGDAEAELIEQFDVDGEGCAHVSVWVSKQWVEQSAGAVEAVVIGHDDGSDWTYFETTVVDERNGWYELRATTDGFSPFGLFVANESNATADSGSTVGDGTAGNGTDGGAAESSAGNESVTANGSAPVNGTAQNATDDTVSEVQSGNASSSTNETVASNEPSTDETNETSETTATNGSSTATNSTTDAGGPESTSTPENQSTQTPSDPPEPDGNEGTSSNETTTEAPQPTEDDETETASTTETTTATATATSTPDGESASLSRVVIE